EIVDGFFVLLERAIRLAARRIDFGSLHVQVDGQSKIVDNLLGLVGSGEEHPARDIDIAAAGQKFDGLIEIGLGLGQVAGRLVIFGASAQSVGIAGVGLERFGIGADGFVASPGVVGLFSPEKGSLGFLLVGFGVGGDGGQKRAGNRNRRGKTSQ